MNICRHRRIIFILVTGGLFLAWLLLPLGGTLPAAYADPGPAFAWHNSSDVDDTLFITPNGSGDCSQADPCSLQTAISQAADGDTLYLAGDTYTGSGSNVLPINLSIALYGGWNGAATGPVVRDPIAYPTILDGENERRVVFIGANITPTLDGLRLINGADNGDGGGIYANGAHPIVRDCHLSNNTANNSGGAIYFNNSPNAQLVGNLIYGNTTNTYYGAGVYIRNGAGTVVMNNTVHDNAAEGSGGGVYVTGSDNVTLQANTIYTNTTNAYGGGIFVGGSDGVRVADNWLFDNAAYQGGGIYLDDSANTILMGNAVHSNVTVDSGGGISLYIHSDGATLTSNAVYSNTAGGNGGGLSLSESTDVTLINNMITGNRLVGTGMGGAGLYLYDVDAYLLHTTIARNTGGSGQGIHLQYAATARMTNTILVSHTVGIEAGAGTTATLSATLWGDGAWANGEDMAGNGTVFTGTINIWGDPVFVHPDSGDYHLGPSSEAIDAGVDAGVTADIDGDARPQDAGYDMGADEFKERWEVFLPLAVKTTAAR